MKNTTLIKAFFSLSVFLWIGCIQNQNQNKEGNYSLLLGLENESGKDISKDISSMGSAFELNDFNQIAFKKATTKKQSGDELDLSLEPWAYDNGWWTRSAKIDFTDDAGAQVALEGSDKVQWKTPDNSPVQFPRLEGANQGEIIHKGSAYFLNKNGGYLDINRDYNLTGVITSTGSDSTLTMNGSLEQSFLAENAARTGKISVEGTATATDITWNREEGHWGKPVSGSIHFESNYRVIDITFDNGVAHIEVEAKQGTYSRSYDVEL